jgi:hypothetical protein
MSKEMYIAYWSGEEPTGSGKSPTLVESPDYIDVIPLFYVILKSDGTLNFDRLVLHNSKNTIKGWMQNIRLRQQNQQKKTKFTLCLIGDSFPSQDPTTFAQTVKTAVDDWGVDGVTIDYEPPDGDNKIVNVVAAIRNAVGANAIMTAPIYDAWTPYPNVLKNYAAVFNYLSTMDYTPYPGESITISLYNQYAQIIGTTNNPSYGKLAIGVSCMEPSAGNATPLTPDVVDLCKYEPQSGNKLGIMLFTLSYDVKSHGSGYPDGTYTKTIHDNLP